MIIEKIHNVETNEITVVERELTAGEIAERETAAAEQAERETAAAAKEVARQAVLSKLGLTAEEVAALLS
jgi:hypothetical protein